MLSLVRKVTTHKRLMHFVLCIYEESTKEVLSGSGRLVSGVLWSVQARMLLSAASASNSSPCSAAGLLGVSVYLTSYLQTVRVSKWLHRFSIQTAPCINSLGPLLSFLLWLPY